MAVFEQVHQGRIGHCFVSQPVNGAGCFFNANIEWQGNVLQQGPAGSSPAQGLPPKKGLADVPQHQVSISYGGAGATPTVAGRANIGRGALGAHVQGTQFIDVGEAVGARPNFDQVDARSGHR